MLILIFWIDVPSTTVQNRCVLTSSWQVPTGIFGVLSVPDGGAHRADQGHDQQDAEQDQDLHVGHSLDIGALQRRLGGVLPGAKGQR